MSPIVLSPFLKFIPKIILIKINLDFNTLYTHLSLDKRKPDFAYDKTKEQISFAVTNREADLRLCFRYMDSTTPLLPKYEISRP